MEPVTTTVGIITLLRNGIKAVSALGKTIKDHQAKIELSNLGSLLVEATQQALEQEQRIAELQQQLASFQRWDETITKYEVVELYEGRYAYKMRTPTTDMEMKLRSAHIASTPGNSRCSKSKGITLGFTNVPPASTCSLLHADKEHRE